MSRGRQRLEPLVTRRPGATVPGAGPGATGRRARVGLIGAALLAAVTATGAAGCAASIESPTPATAALQPTSEARSSLADPESSPTPTVRPTLTATPSEAPQPTPPPGTTLVAVPDAGVEIPVPDGWVQVPAADLTDPASRADLAAKYPGSDTLLAQTDRLDGRATPVLLAVDPTAADRDEPLAANLSVLVTKPSVGGPLLDLAAGFIADGLADGLGATGAPVKEHIELAAGEAVRVGLELPPKDGRPISGTAWVIGAPGGTMLVTLLGPSDTLAAMDPDALVQAIMPVSEGQP